MPSPVGPRGTVRWRAAVTVVAGAAVALVAAAGTIRAAGPDPRLTTWDGRHAIGVIDATLVYFVPADRMPLADWAERLGWFAERITRFHDREFAGQSRVRATVHPRPVVSALPTRLVRAGDANAVFDRTLREVEAALGFGAAAGGFPVLVVFSDVNWRPLDDFSRQEPVPGGWRFDGSLATDGSHVPGARAGGSRAVYLADAGKGWGLVSADGWRVPMRGSDCVVYHEGIGHAIGLPHTEPLDGSVMGLGQYHGWLGESWVDEAQKRRLGWQPRGRPAERGSDLLGGFRALPRPATPRPGETVALALERPAGTALATGRVEVQTSLRGPWVTLPLTGSQLDEGLVPLGTFDRPGGVAYRVRVATADADGAAADGDAAGAAAEVWGYFQVRAEPTVPPVPVEVDPADRRPADTDVETAAAVELLPLIDPRRAVLGDWQAAPAADGGEPALVSPRAFGARIEIPHAPPPAYRLTVVATPLDEPHGLVLGQRSPAGRFVVLLDFRLGDGWASALENVDGRNVQSNPTRCDGPVFRRGRPALVVCTVRGDGVEVQVDGRTLIDWRGDPARLSLADYWATPDAGRLFLGTYDCRYRFQRVTLEPLAARADAGPGGAAP